MKYKATMYQGKVKKLSDAQIKAVAKTAEQLRTEIIDSQFMPFDTGHMQNTQTYVEQSKAKSGEISITTETPYANRLYFHPEYNFDKTTNKNARGLWWEPWINGAYKDRPMKIFKKFMSLILSKEV